jgi:hypothetical protein
MKVLEISCPEINMDLDKMLQFVKTIGVDMDWKIVNFEGVSKREAYFPHDEIEKAIAMQGFWPVSWHDLCALSQSIAQTIWCSVHATDRVTGEEIVIEAFDGCSWMIATANTQILEHILDVIPAAKETNVGQMEYPPTAKVPLRKN